MACNAKHQLHKFRDFCAMTHNRKMAIVKKNALCINCLRPGHLVFHGQRFGPLGSLSAIKTQFGWVLPGAVNIGHASWGSTNQCYMSTIAKENLRMDNSMKNFGRHTVEISMVNLS